MKRVSIPPLREELSNILQRTVTAKKYDRNDIKDWPSHLTFIIERLELIEKSGNIDNESAEIEPDLEVNVKIKKIRERISKHLNENFHDNPPFTIIRLAELILHPKKGGYILDNTQRILKYFNSLEKVISVSSSITDFPETTFGMDFGSKISREPAMRKQNAVNIELVEIPWLKDINIQKNKNQDKTTDETSIKDQNIDNEVIKEQIRDKVDDDTCENRKESSTEQKEQNVDAMIISPPSRKEEMAFLDVQNIQKLNSSTTTLTNENEKKKEDIICSKKDDHEQAKKRPGTTGQEHLIPTKKLKNVDEVDDVDDNMEISQTEITDV